MIIPFPYTSLCIFYENQIKLHGPHTIIIYCVSSFLLTCYPQLPFVCFTKPTLSNEFMLTACVYFCQDFCGLFLEDIPQKGVDKKGPYFNIWQGQWEESLAKVVLTVKAGTQLRRSHSSAKQWNSHYITTSMCGQQSRFTIGRAILNKLHVTSQTVWQICFSAEWCIQSIINLRSAKQKAVKCDFNQYFIWGLECDFG